MSVAELIEHLEAAGLKPVVIDDETPIPLEAPSPFIPETNIQFAWDSTSLGNLKRCPRLYELVNIEGWQPKGENIDLRFGIEFHQALHDYEKCKAAGLDHEESLFQAVKASLERTWKWEKVNPRSKGQELKTRRNLIRSVIWYLEKYKDDQAETVILSNGKPACELSFSFELNFGPIEGQPYILCGHLDRVVEFQGHVFGMDRKTTTKTLGPYYFDQYEPDNQMTLYTFATQVIYQAPVKGMIVDGAQIMVGGSRFVRGITYRTSEQLEEWVEDLRYWLGAAEDYALAGYWPMNDTACDKYGGCRFRGICNKSPSVRENFLRSDFEKGERWNPLKPR